MVVALLLPAAASAQETAAPAMPGFDAVNPKPKAKPKSKSKSRPAPPAPAASTPAAAAGGGVDAGTPSPDGGAPSPDGGAPSPDGGAPGAGEAGVTTAPVDGGVPEAAVVETPPPPPPPPPSGKGRIEGTVVDGKTGEAVIEAQITVLETKKKVLTDIDGNYQLSLPPGTYTLRVWAELKAARRISSIVVEKSKTTRIDVTLGEDTKAVMQEIVVVAKPDTATEAVQLVRRQKSATVSDAISAEQLSRTPDTNASEAVKRVVGATIQDGKYVIIRGLGGRYSLVLLNGVTLPSPDPDLPSAPLDLFPAALLANLTIAKTFTPDLPGTFAGGALLIETRDYPSHFTLKVRLGTAVDSTATFRQVNSQQGGSLDFLGYDDGTRALPAAVPRDKPAKLTDYLSNPLYTQEQLNTMGAAFNNRWGLYTHRALPGLGLGVTIGDTVTVAGRKLGYLGTVLYGDRWTRQQPHLAYYNGRNADGSIRPSTLQEDVDTGIETTAVGALLNVGYTISPTHRLGFISMYMHNTEKSSSLVVGTENNSSIIDRYRFRFLQRQLQFNQLTGEHAFGGGRLIVAWQGNLSFTGQQEPDTIDLFRVQGTDGVYRISGGTGAADRTFGDLHESTVGLGTDITVPFKAIRLKTGGTISTSPRESRVRRFHFEIHDDTLASLPPDQALAPQNIQSGGVNMDERTQPTDAFDATRTVYNAYLMADLVRLEPLRLIGGARLDIAKTDLTTGKTLDNNPNVIKPVNRQDRAILPALNAVYALSNRSNLRAAYGGTVARPHLRELSATQFYDYVRARVVSGNPDLVQTYIHNADLRWELFPSGAEVLAASAFYKYFQNPIERTAVPAGDGTNITFQNADHAQEFGIELEARANGGRLRPSLEPLYVGANFTYISSQVDRQTPGPGGMGTVTTTRPLQGQSPYVINFEVGYRKGGTQLSLLYNVFGRRIAEVGTAGLGDVYEEPFHRLDVTLNQKLPDGLTLKVSGTNLLNQQISFRQGSPTDSPGVPIYSYKPGVTGLAVLEWSYEGANK